MINVGNNTISKVYLGNQEIKKVYKGNQIIYPYDAEIEYLGSTGTQWIDTSYKGNTTRMTFKDLVLFMEKNKDLYIMTDTKYIDVQSIEIEFDEMTSIINNHKELYERFIIEIYNEKMFFFLKEKNYLFKYFVFTLYQRWEPQLGLKDLENIFDFCSKYKINAILLFSNLLNESFLKFSLNYSIPIYLHTVNDIGNSVDFLKKGVKGIITDNITYQLLEQYLLDNNIKLNKEN